MPTTAEKSKGNGETDATSRPSGKSLILIRNQQVGGPIQRAGCALFADR
jgi:hypothetical protein